MIREIADTDPEGIDQLLTEFEGGTVFDVGANAGQSARVLLRKFEQVVSCEPADESFELLKTVDRAGKVFVPLKVAVTDKNGPVVLSVQSEHIKTGQLTSTDPALKGESWAGPADPWGEVVGTRQVSGVTIDQLTETFGMPDLIKIDVEGHEDRVMDGAEATLAEGTTAWFVECHSKELAEKVRQDLLDAGYAPETFRHPHYAEGSWGWANHFWLRALPLRAC